ncbi:MAG: hypothetical protein ACR2HG_09335 [Pyrinomonadaceae bacterium]
MSDKNKNSINIHDIMGDVVASNNQTGGITAHTVNFAKPQRQIDEPFKEDLSRELKKHVTDNRPVALMIYQGYDAEAIKLYNQIKDFLTDSGINFSNDGFTTFIPSQPECGIKINLLDPNNVALMIFPRED